MILGMHGTGVGTGDPLGHGVLHGLGARRGVGVHPGVGVPLGDHPGGQVGVEVHVLLWQTSVLMVIGL